MEAILMKAASFIAVIILGYGLRKAGFFKEEDFYVLSKIVLKITLPASIIANFSQAEIQPAMLLLCLVGFAGGVLYMSLGWILGGKDRDEKAFHILNNFDIPTGTEQPWGKASADVPSATQFTVVTDTRNRIIYYRTMYNSNIRCIDLKTIDFENVRYYSMPLDDVKKQPVERIDIK